jgi:hypothetical protein
MWFLEQAVLTHLQRSRTICCGRRYCWLGILVRLAEKLKDYPGEPVSFDLAAPHLRRAMKPDNRPPDTKRRQEIQPANR